MLGCVVGERGSEVFERETSFLVNLEVPRSKNPQKKKLTKKIIEPKIFSLLGLDLLVHIYCCLNEPKGQNKNNMSRIALSNIANTDSVKTNNKRSMVSTNLTQSTIQERDASSASSSSSSSDPVPKKRKLVTHIQDNEKEGHDGRSTVADYLLPCPSQFQQVINPSMFTQKLIIYCHAGEHSVNANGFNEKNHRAITLCMGKEVQFILKNDATLLVHPLQLLNSVTSYDMFNHKGHGCYMIKILDGVLGEDFKKGNSYDNNYQAFKSLKKTYEYYFDVSEESDVSELDVKIDQKNQQQQKEDDEYNFEMLEKNTQDTICLRGKSVEPDALLNAIDLHGGIE